MQFQVTKENVETVEQIYNAYKNFYNYGMKKQLIWLNTLKKEIDRVKKEENENND